MDNRKPRLLLFLLVVVLTNYVAQIPYALHLYRLNVNPRGAGLLGLTLTWFLIGFWLLLRKNPIGFWLTLAFLAVQFLFYFNNQIINMIYGYGLIYHLAKLDDPVIWAVEAIGDVNFLAAAFFLLYLFRNRVELQGGALTHTA